MFIKRLLYVSDSLIGDDKAALNQILEEARKNNNTHDLTGLLWTNGEQFAQVIEGEQEAIFDVLDGLLRDSRHENVNIASLRSIHKRVFGTWAMTIATNDSYDDKMEKELVWLDHKLSRVFKHIINTKII